MRGVRWGSFVDPQWLESGFGRAVVLKLGFFVAVLALSAVHDFRIGPSAARELERNPASEQSAKLRRTASMMGRVTALVAILLFGLGVVLVRGWP